MPNQWDDTPKRKRFKKLPSRRRSKPVVEGQPDAEPPTRRSLLDRLADPGTMALALGWATAGLSNRDISVKLGCSVCALDKVLSRNTAIYQRFNRARLKIKEEALAGLRKKFATDWRAAAFFLERQAREEFGTTSANAVELPKLFKKLQRLATGIKTIIPEAMRGALDAMLAEFIDSLSMDEGAETEGTP